MHKVMNLITIAVLWAALLAPFPACDWSETIRVGFLGTLTGSNSTISTQARDAVILALEEQNAKGGILGHKLMLFVRNTDGSAASVTDAGAELLDKGVVAVLGLPTSGIAIRAVGLFNKHRVVMISSTASTQALTGLDDYFFRVRSDLSATATAHGAYAHEKAGLRKVFVIREETNSEYTASWFAYFREAFEAAGGKTAGVLNFHNRQPVSHKKIAQKAVAQNPDGILMACSDHDTALISQQLRLCGFKGALLANGWAVNHSLLIHGGSAVEGLISAQPFNPSSGNPRWLEFKRLYQQRFGREAGYEAMASYNSAVLLFKALIVSRREDIPLKQAMLQTNRVDGLQGVVMLNKFGDAVVDQHIIAIKGGKVVKVN